MNSIKIQATKKEHKEEIKTRALNIAQVFVQYGRLPGQYELDPDNGFVYIVDGDKVDLYPRSNDFWAFLKDETETSVVIRFKSRYNSQEPRITALLHAIAGCLLDFKDGATIEVCEV